MKFNIHFICMLSGHSVTTLTFTNICHVWLRKELNQIMYKRLAMR